jgi:hypothetical protein
MGSLVRSLDGACARDAVAGMVGYYGLAAVEPKLVDFYISSEPAPAPEPVPEEEDAPVAAEAEPTEDAAAAPEAEPSAEPDAPEEATSEPAEASG